MKERPILFSAPMVRALLDGRNTQTRRIVNPQPKSGAPIQISAWEDGVTAFKPGEFGVYRDGLRPGVWGLESVIRCPHGQPGDMLYVKEAHEFVENPEGIAILYKADYAEIPAPVNRNYTPKTFKGRPSIHMPRWASRILLEITSVRVERLQDISEEDAIAEGCEADTPQTWWQGYMWDEHIEDYIHQQHMGDSPPEWMVEPKRMACKPWLVRSAKDHYRALWESINGAGSWGANPWVWVISFKRVQA